MHLSLLLLVSLTLRRNFNYISDADELVQYTDFGTTMARIVRASVQHKHKPEPATDIQLQTQDQSF